MCFPRHGGSRTTGTEEPFEKQRYPSRDEAHIDLLPIVSRARCDDATIPMMTQAQQRANELLAPRRRDTLLKRRVCVYEMVSFVSSMVFSGPYRAI